MSLLTLEHFDDALECIREKTGHKDLDLVCSSIADMMAIFKSSHLELINELLALYDSASEHNVDIGRRAIFDLAQRLSHTDE